MQSRPEKLLRWFIFSVLIALVPLAAGFCVLALHQQSPSVGQLTARGELLLVSAAIASAAVGELLPGGGRYPLLKLAAGGACMVLVLLSSLVFSAVQTQPSPDPDSIFTASVWLFAGTLLASFIAVYLACEGKQT